MRDSTGIGIFASMKDETMNALVTEAMRELKADNEGERLFAESREHAASYVYYRAVRDGRVEPSDSVRVHNMNIRRIWQAMNVAMRKAKS